MKMSCWTTLGQCAPGTLYEDKYGVFGVVRYLQLAGSRYVKVRQDRKLTTRPALTAVYAHCIAHTEEKLPL